MSTTYLTDCVSGLKKYAPYILVKTWGKYLIVFSYAQFYSWHLEKWHTYVQIIFHYIWISTSFPFLTAWLNGKNLLYVIETQKLVKLNEKGYPWLLLPGTVLCWFWIDCRIGPKHYISWSWKVWKGNNR